MKKTVLLVCIIMVCLCGCGSKETKTPEYYWYTGFVMPKSNETMEKDEEMLLKGENLQRCEEIYHNVCEYYGVEKEIPQFCIVQDTFINESITQEAVYDYDGIVFLREDLFSTNTDIDCANAIIAHEILHHFGCLEYEESEYLFGHYLNEGATNYLSTQVYPLPEGVSSYEYETHCCELIANAIGEETFRECYFNSDIQVLRDDFNAIVKGIYPEFETPNETNIRISAFDAFAANLDNYSLLLTFMYTPGFEVNYNEKLSWLSQIMNSLEEELLTYNEEKGKNATEITKKLLDNNSGMIPFGKITEFATMIKG